MHWLRLAQQQQQQHEECAIDGNCEECGQVDHSGGYGALGLTVRSNPGPARLVIKFSIHHITKQLVVTVW